jgi:hypothetical protein
MSYKMQTITVGETYMIVNGNPLKSGNTFYGKVVRKNQFVPTVVTVLVDGIELRCLFHPTKYYGWTFYKKQPIFNNEIQELLAWLH